MDKKTKKELPNGNDGNDRDDTVHSLEAIARLEERMNYRTTTEDQKDQKNIPFLL
ncbi:MAG: hypothetical protein OXC68_14610 [Aestuariivita sp.]|nr:hypothetical protein [Aestuariivita sp.]